MTALCLSISLSKHLILRACEEKAREKELATELKKLKCVAKKKHLAIFLTAQLPRYIEYRKNKRPLLSDLSPLLARLSDTVILLYRSNYYEVEHTPNDVCSAELILAKNRFGRKMTLDTRFNWRYLQFNVPFHTWHLMKRLKRRP